MKDKKAFFASEGRLLACKATRKIRYRREKVKGNILRLLKYS